MKIANLKTHRISYKRLALLYIFPIYRLSVGYSLLWVGVWRYLKRVNLIPTLFFIILPIGVLGQIKCKAMFQKKRSPKSETRTINVGGIPVKATIDEEGNITADYSIRVNGQKYDFAEKTTIAEITQISQNEDNSNSCEKEPNSSEVKIPVAGFFEEYQLGLVGSEIGDRVWAASMRAKRKGYNYFTVSREDFEYVQNKAKKQ